jgi:hypothetical protein
MATSSSVSGGNRAYRRMRYVDAYQNAQNTIVWPWVAGAVVIGFLVWIALLNNPVVRPVPVGPPAPVVK